MLHPFSPAENRPLTAATRIIGVGSPFGDDRAGWVAIERLRASAWFHSRASSLNAGCLDRPGPRLLTAMAGAAQVVVLDAMRSGAPPGTVRRVGLDEIARGRRERTAVHGFALADTLALGAALGLLPPTLTVIAVEADPSHAADELSARVRAALPRMLACVRASVGR